MTDCLVLCQQAHAIYARTLTKSSDCAQAEFHYLCALCAFHQEVDSRHPLVLTVYQEIADMYAALAHQLQKGGNEEIRTVLLIPSLLFLRQPPSTPPSLVNVLQIAAIQKYESILYDSECGNTTTYATHMVEILSSRAKKQYGNTASMPLAPALPSMVTWVLPRPGRSREIGEEDGSEDGSANIESEKRAHNLCHAVRRKLLHLYISTGCLSLVCSCFFYLV